MYQIEMMDENILVQKVEEKNKSDFDTGGGSSDPRGAVYRIIHAPSESVYKAKELVLLSPGNYEGLKLEGEMYTVITSSDILAKVMEAKS